MIIQIDTREQKNSHIEQYFAEHGIKTVRSKMFVGDYMDISNGLLCIDKKYGLDEVYNCVVGSHERFRAECVRAQESGIQLIILVEEPTISSLDAVHTWRNPRADKWYMVHGAQLKGKMLGIKIPKKPPLSSQKLEIIMRTMSERYGVEWQFCRKEQTAERIIQILTKGGEKNGQE